MFQHIFAFAFVESSSHHEISLYHRYTTTVVWNVAVLIMQNDSITKTVNSATSFMHTECHVIALDDVKNL